MSDVQHVYDIIFQEPLTVKVKGHTLTLTRPKWESLKHLLLKYNELSRRLKEDPTGQSAVVDGYEMAILSIQACLPNCTEDQASHLFTVSGMFEGELYNKCLELCGSNKLSDEKAEALDPTSELHEN